MVSTEYNREVLRMRNAETVLNVIRERGERGLPLENIYRLLYNRNLNLRAYGRIYSNQGATTKGVNRGDHGRYVTGENRPHHRSVALRAVPVDACATGQHSQA